jgi:hypothetical protein
MNTQAQKITFEIGGYRDRSVTVGMEEAIVSSRQIEIASPLYAL